MTENRTDVHIDGGRSPSQAGPSIDREVAAISSRFKALSTIAGVLATAFFAPERLPAQAKESSAFRFEQVVSLQDMHQFLEQAFSLGSARADMRKLLRDEGKATLVSHPSQPGVEKYIYDINLCDYYIWRWNISADFDANGHLLQSYVNGEPVFAAGKQKLNSNVLAKSGHAAILRMTRLRPQAVKGETELSYLMLDADGNPKTIDDQVLTGAGPSRADPTDMGKAHSYVDIEPWRSIFDMDETDHIASYTGDCKAVDRLGVRK